MSHSAETCTMVHIPVDIQSLRNVRYARLLSPNPREEQDLIVFHFEGNIQSLTQEELSILVDSLEGELQPHMNENVYVLYTHKSDQMLARGHVRYVNVIPEIDDNGKPTGILLENPMTQMGTDVYEIFIHDIGNLPTISFKDLQQIAEDRESDDFIIMNPTYISDDYMPIFAYGGNVPSELHNRTEALLSTLPEESECVIVDLFEHPNLQAQAGGRFCLYALMGNTQASARETA